MLVKEKSTGRIIPRLQPSTTTTTTTIEYELLKADPSYDYWACGMLLYDVSYDGAFPFVTNNNEQPHLRCRCAVAHGLDTGRERSETAE